jgi:hypothetical protein
MRLRTRTDLLPDKTKELTRINDPELILDAGLVFVN